MKIFLSMIITILIVLTNCISTENPTKISTPSQPAPAPLWTGDGGKGMSITILAPQATGLAENQAYLPAMVQGEFVANFDTYSAISVLDRVRLDEQYSELLSGYYSDDAQAGMDLGKLTPTSHILGGNITKTSTGYVLQMHITKTDDKTTTGSYSGNFTFAEMDNLSAIRLVSLDLLQKMGVTPTTAAQSVLKKAAEVNHVNAQTALAQGIVAQRQGNTVEAMARIYEAAAYDTSIKEATARANSMSANIRTGSMGQNIRNDIAWRDEWKKILDDATKYLKANPPVIAYIIYDPAIKQGATDYNKRTADLYFELELRGAEYPPAYIKMIEDINAGLAATRRNDTWKLQPLTAKAYTQSALWENEIRIRINAELTNNNGRVIANMSNDDDNNVRFSDIGTVSGVGNGSSFRAHYYLRPKIHFTVNANDITDQMTIRVTATTFRYRWNTIERTNNTVQVLTRSEFLTQVGTNGLPPMKKVNLIFISNWDSVKSPVVIVEEAMSDDDRYFGLSYRQLSQGKDKLLIRYQYQAKRTIDISNYIFPLSVAFLGNNFYDDTKIIIIRDFEPGQTINTPKNCDGVIIVPKGWFQQNGIKSGYLVSVLDSSLYSWRD